MNLLYTGWSGVWVQIKKTRQKWVSGDVTQSKQSVTVTQCWQNNYSTSHNNSSHIFLVSHNWTQTDLTIGSLAELRQGRTCNKSLSLSIISWRRKRSESLEMTDILRVTSIILQLVRVLWHFVKPIKSYWLELLQWPLWLLILTKRFFIKMINSRG